YVLPQGNGVRVDDGFEQGMAIPIYYDPMIAKLITYGNTRAEAIEKMIRAIDEYQISGVQTTLPFCRFVMEHEAFRSGQFDTSFVSRYFTAERLKTLADPAEEELAAVLAAWLMETAKPKAAGLSESGQLERRTVSRWKANRSA
ncbi:MAG: biotin carboxylase, partial [Bacteroidetes bacterium]|nr:biotin carboxylase [Fibrella sp.]